MRTATYGVQEVIRFRGGGEFDTGINRFDTYRGAYGFLNDCIDGRDLPKNAVVSKLTLSEVDGDRVTPLAAFLKWDRGTAIVASA